MGGRAPAGAPAPFALVEPPRPRRACAVDHPKIKRVSNRRKACYHRNWKRLTSENRRSPTGTSDASALHRIGPDALEHGCLLQHIWHNDEAQHVASDVDVFEMRLLAIGRCDGDVLHGNVEVILGCKYKGADEECQRLLLPRFYSVQREKQRRTIVESASVGSSAFELDGDDVAHRLMDELDWNPDRTHGDESCEVANGADEGRNGRCKCRVSLVLWRRENYD